MGIDRPFTKLSSEYPPVRYRKITLYVSTRLGILFRKAAFKTGFRVVDFARVLITLGLTVTLLSLDEAWVTTASKRALLGGLGEAGKRGYADRSMGRSGVWVAVCLPVQVLTLVEEFARSSGMGRNEALRSFLQLGLATYLKGKVTLQKLLTQVERGEE